MIALITALIVSAILAGLILLLDKDQKAEQGKNDTSFAFNIKTQETVHQPTTRCTPLTIVA